MLKSLCLIKHYAMKTYGGLEVSLHHSWTRHLMEMSGQLHVPAPLPQGRAPVCPLVRRVGGPQRRSGRCGGEKNLAMLGIERGSSSQSPIAIPTHKQTPTLLKSPIHINEFDKKMKRPKDYRNM
jgi:hypothetical protein